MKTVYIETLGCQMNVLDSELVASELQRIDWQLVDAPNGADAILFNTCSVRQHAEDKVWSALGRLKQYPRQRPDVIIGVLGCMAQREQATIFKRAPHCHFVIGPGRIGHIADVFRRVESGERGIVEVSADRRHTPTAEILADFEPFNPSRAPIDPQRLAVADAVTPPISSSHPNTEADSGLEPRFRTARPNPYQAMVRIQLGCDNFCTYCIVPYVRGPQQCRAPNEIVEETRQLVNDGVVEVTLIGQTVNAYRWTAPHATMPGGSSETGSVGLAALLGELQRVDGLRRIRFLTNYPREMTPELIAAVRENDKVCPFFHVPAQSGSDRVLRRMNRHYTVAGYREMLDRIREAIPDASITSDFIVGFCGETNEEFEETARLVRDARFRNSFVFKYSPRPGAKAAERLADDVPDEVKRRRNHELLAIQKEISAEDQLAMAGKSVEILVEGISKGNRRPLGEAGSPGGAVDPVVQLVGRTVHDQIVVFDGPPSLAGQILPIRIERAEPFTLFGRTL